MFFFFNLFTTCWQCCNLGGANCNYASAASQGAMALYQCCGKDQTGAYYCCPSQVLLVRGTLRLLRNKYLLCRWARLSTSAPSTDRSIRSAYCIASVCVASGLIIVGQCAVRPSPYPPPAPSPSKHGGGGSGGTVAGIVVSCAYLLFFKHTFGWCDTGDCAVLVILGVVGCVVYCCYRRYSNASHAHRWC